MKGDLLLLINPRAGQMRANRLLPQVIRTVLDADYRCVTYVTAHEGDATDYVAAHAHEFVRIVCIGGDGTVNETIAGLRKSGVSIPIGYIPAGTTNDYASSLGLSSNIEQAAKDAVEGEGVLLDLGEFNGRSFTYTATCGAFVKVSYATPQKLKNAFGHLAYVLNSVTDLSSLRPYHLHVTTDSECYDGDFLLCAVTNSSSVAGILKLDVSIEKLHDGVFELLLVRNPQNAYQLGEILNRLATQTLEGDMFCFVKTAHITIHSDEAIEWTLDGERAGALTDIQINNLHNAVRIIVPQTENRTETETPCETTENDEN